MSNTTLCDMLLPSRLAAVRRRSGKLVPAVACFGRVIVRAVLVTKRKLGIPTTSNGTPYLYPIFHQLRVTNISSSHHDETAAPDVGSASETTVSESSQD